MSDEMRGIVRRWSEEMWSRGDLDAADEIFAADYVDHDALPGQPDGREGAKQSVSVFRSAFPDLRVTNEDVLITGEYATVRWTATGTHDGDLMGVPPTNKQVRLKGIDIVRIVDGLIVERWGEFDGLGLMGQIQS